MDDLENLDLDELDELLGLKPTSDIPPAARRSLAQVGLLSRAEGGLPMASLANQPASIVRASLGGIRGPMVSRWGHIMMRRALASRLAAPSGMNPVEFAALRAQALNRMGEFRAARAIVQDVDTGNWNDPLLDAALDAYIGTADIVGACPAVTLSTGDRDDPQWDLWKSICYAFTGQTARARGNLNSALSKEIAPQIDILLAQRYARAAGGQGAVNLEWDGVDELTPWRFALATALGAEIPEALRDRAGPYYQKVAAVAPMLPLSQKIGGADLAGGQGILSSAAMVDLYSQVMAEGGAGDAAALTASRLREAYVAVESADRMAAIRDLWGGEQRDYGRMVLTAYAAARIAPSEEMADEAPDLIASMLTAGLDADALTWAPYAPQGGEAWALLVLAQPERQNPVSEAQLEDFIGDDESEGQRKSQFLVAGLAGLGRLDGAARDEAVESLGMDIGTGTKWSRLIAKAADVNNPALVAYLAGVGMQGSGWDKMTPRHLYHIVSALNRTGMTAEARMIAAEAVARG
ncbi:hypothetical protein GRI41_04415 [Altererythrobacter aquaemixtae]|uniref:Uncharacterized protein n=1 Tax=Pontixanthobacter aquaemixtae TaxID=1958940 RepID=A0A844ZQN2_9SPHN|nr:hypothetical protein [Pontixanthobacter aquaemixtae]